jgi:NAD kinase
MANVPRIVVISRPTDYEMLLARHATRGQAGFFLYSRGQDIDAVENDHNEFMRAMDLVTGAIPPRWRSTRVCRGDLDRFLFEPDDIVVVVGQDGLVANAAKYLGGQPVIGINPLPHKFDGVLVRHPPESARELLTRMDDGWTLDLERRTMVEAVLDDGQRLLALNEIFLGHRTHQSARYRISFAGIEERHSSSGVIIATGTGSTGWARSVNLSRGESLALPAPFTPQLAFFVREAFPSIATETDLTEGLVGPDQTLSITSEMNAGGVIFGDGIEDDHLRFGFGQTVELRIANAALMLAAA